MSEQIPNKDELLDGIKNKNVDVNVLNKNDFEFKSGEVTLNYSKTRVKIFADLKTDKSGFIAFDAQGNLYSSIDKGSKIYKIAKIS